MLRRSGSGMLRSENDFTRREEVDPMSAVANLVDAMLVLAVGIMLALIVSWNLNISENGQVSDNARKENAISDFTEDEVTNSPDIPSENLEKQGTVYYDPDTDKYYVIVQDGTQITLDD
jgi:hypothetical protein